MEFYDGVYWVGFYNDNEEVAIYKRSKILEWCNLHLQYSDYGIYFAHIKYSSIWFKNKKEATWFLLTFND